MSGYVDRDRSGNPIAWMQKMKGKWRRFRYVAGYELNNPKKNRERVRADFDCHFPFMVNICTIVRVSDALYEEITDKFIPRWLKAKENEPRIAKVDPIAQVKRGMTGFLGEAAMETYLGVPVLDRDSKGRIAVGNSKTFAGADLAKQGLDIGVKSSEFPNFPVIKRSVRRPQVICLKIGERDYYVGGYASMNVQRGHIDSRIVLDDYLRNKRLYNNQLEKTGFYGFPKLIPFSSIEELRGIYHKYH